MFHIAQNLDRAVKFSVIMVVTADISFDPSDNSTQYDNGGAVKVPIHFYNEMQSYILFENQDKICKNIFSVTKIIEFVIIKIIRPGYLIANVRLHKLVITLLIQTWTTPILSLYLSIKAQYLNYLNKHFLCYSSALYLEHKTSPSDSPLNIIQQLATQNLDSLETQYLNSLYLIVINDCFDKTNR
ncbi:unnamed protein product [Leptidea sinapis]|uniref:Uncharacterized protein n=1 Tax=Leptidea sinapis TaxID=189913 RepID=A0A5E4QZT5_9NEOP|nr:unnamed protein product [Leptidea sinapis]